MNHSLSDLRALCSQSVSSADFPLCSQVSSKIPLYEVGGFDLDDYCKISKLQDEWHHILLSGPGVFVIKRMQLNASLMERTNANFQTIIDAEKASSKGDHFAPFGKNDRIWNSFSKHALADAACFMQYYSNPWLALVCDAWLGPAYRITAQVNIVKPGGAAQVSHRDYHLGFQTESGCAAYPKVFQTASQLLTLQGAIAHTDMPLESGPTRFLPFSQRFEAGYMAYRRPEFNQFFLENYVHLPLQKGDAVFFNPALFHAAGENQTYDLSRSANLLQVSSAFGKSMETIDTLPLIECSWDLLKAKHESEGMSFEVDAFVKAVAEGYPFPTNLNKRPPGAGGLAPESQQDILKKALTNGTELKALMHDLIDIRAAEAS
ncbi:MAG: hypothetical protein Q9191_001325 [Dirinaria sp. TL-2023a]